MLPHLGAARARERNHREHRDCTEVHRGRQRGRQRRRRNDRKPSCREKKPGGCSTEGDGEVLSRGAKILARCSVFSAFLCESLCNLRVLCGYAPSPGLLQRKRAQPPGTEMCCLAARRFSPVAPSSLPFSVSLCAISVSSVVTFPLRDCSNANGGSLLPPFAMVNVKCGQAGRASAASSQI
jgi:hypothetical protein